MKRIRKIFLLLSVLLSVTHVEAQFIINPYSVAASHTYFLDQFPGAACAFSFEKLSSTFSGNCVRVIRSSDGTAQNFGFVNNYVDTASILSFVGAGNGRIQAWIDQTANGRTAWAPSGLEPLIVQSGVLCTKNGYVCARNPTASSGAVMNLIGTFSTTSFSTLQSLPVTAIFAGNIITLPTNGLGNAGWVLGGTNFSRYEMYVSTSGFNAIRRNTSGTINLSVNPTINYNPYIQQAFYRSSQLAAMQNGVDATPISYSGSEYNTASDFSLMQNINSTYNPAMNAYMYVIYLSDQYSNRVAIDTYIKNRYSIY